MPKDAFADIEPLVVCTAFVIFHFAVPLIGRELWKVELELYLRLLKPPTCSSGSAPHVASLRASVGDVKAVLALTSRSDLKRSKKLP